MKKSHTLFLLFFLAHFSYAQSKHDNIWVLGHPPNIPEENSGGTEMDFRRHPVEARFFEIPIPFYAISMISDSTGRLMFYSNGCKVINFEHELMVNGDSINPGRVHDIYCEDGYHGAESIMALPLPGSKDIYYMFHLWVNDDLVCTELRYSLVDMGKQNGLGEVLEKNTIVLSDYFASQISAVRHGNGRDWWIIAPQTGTNKYFKFLFTPAGIPKIYEQEVGSGWDHRYWSGQAVFSPDGNKYIRMNPFNGLYIFDFDRCSGELYNPLKIDFPGDTIYTAGASVSPNNRYLYVSASLKVYQFDLWASNIAASRITVAEYDGFVSPLYTTFYQHMLAPNGKIYITAPNGVNVLHVINHPNKPGLECDLEQHGLILPTLHAFAPPNFPNFRTSAKDGSPCDTLGIDMPVAVREHDNKPGFKVYPNPARDRLFVEVPENYAQDTVSCLLFDVPGRLVNKKSIEGSINPIEMDISNLTNGFYFYQLIQENVILQTGKIVVHE